MSTTQIKENVIKSLAKLGIREEASRLFIEREQKKQTEETEKMIQHEILNQRNDKKSIKTKKSTKTEDMKDPMWQEYNKYFLNKKDAVDDNIINIIPSFKKWKQNPYSLRVDQ